MLAIDTRREGIWDGQTTALIAAKEVIRLEKSSRPPEQGGMHDEGVDVTHEGDGNVTSGPCLSQS